MTSGLPLRRALALLRDELALAQQYDRNAKLGLRIDGIELDLALQLDAEAALEAEAGVEGKVPWLVVGKARAKGSTKAAAAYTHRIQLTITPLDLNPGNQAGDTGAASVAATPDAADDESRTVSTPPGPLLVGDSGLRRDTGADSEQ
jgi:hypothetical protein